MRICFLNHDLKENTGAGRFGLQLISRLRQEYPDFHPVVLTTEGSGHPWEKPVLSYKIFELIFAIPRIRSLFKECDIVHALDGFPYGVIAAMVSLGLGKKLVITAVGTGAIRALRHPIKGVLLRWAYHRADKLVAVSNYTKREILSRVSGLDISVINHGVGAGELSESSKEEFSENEKLEIEKLKPYVLSVGGWKRRKGFEYSFPAFAEITRFFPKMKYVVVGAAAPKLRLSEPLGITGRVLYFRGIRRPFLKALYRNAELFMLLPYNDNGDVEGFGFVFLEAAAAGLPVVGTYDSGAEDAVGHGRNGFLVATQDAHAAAEAAISILSNAELKKQFSRESLVFAKEMSWGRAVGKYTAIYHDLFLRN